MTSYEPVYIQTAKSGKLREKIEKAYNILESCEICPRLCRVNRLEDEPGVCDTGKQAIVASYNAHFGEESPLVGKNGSGTIFFTYCNLKCIFCQNYDISHEGYGEKVREETLANIMIDLQTSGCHNINFVTPSHVVPQILSALESAVEKGLKVPLVYNCGGYDNVETLKLLEGVIDIYMPDFKFWDANVAELTCEAEDYPGIACDALKEMHRQVGDLETDEKGIARSGLLVRHLVLPENMAGTRDVMRFIANEISKDTYVNIMPQYRPCGRASEVKGLARHPKRSEYEKAVEEAKEEGIHRLDKRRPIFMMV
jgi:putative pyruvate formate lyase activating enzyme